MKTSVSVCFVRLFAVALLMTLSVGCATNGPSNSGPCPSKYSLHYQDAARGFSLCLPAGVQVANTGGRLTFTGFPVPAGTNLQQKSLVVVSGSYDMLQGATPAGSFTADGVVFKRVRTDEGSAGHSTLHVIYTWQKAGKTLHFDFMHYAVNVGNFDPPNRPPEYEKAAQIKLSEEIMGTFKKMN
jgi:hypothetical protein